MVEGTQNLVLLEMIERTRDILPGGMYDNYLQLFKGLSYRRGIGLILGDPSRHK